MTFCSDTNSNLDLPFQLARLKYADDHIEWGAKWRDVIFSDEKKFNLDGPDGSANLWHYVLNDKTIRWSRNFGGGSCMVWGAFCSKGTLPLRFTTCKMKSQDYIDMIAPILLEDGREMLGDNMIFLQDNASIHTSKFSKAWFTANNIKLVDHPAVSPDLNIIENLWGFMVHRVYGNNRQYGVLNELKESIQEAWDSIPQVIIDKLIASMHERLVDVLKAQGGKTRF